MTKVIQVSLARSRFRLEQKELQTQLEINVLPMLQVDPRYMQQMMDNLISHACRSSDPGTPIEIRAHVEGDNGNIDRLQITISHTNRENAIHRDMQQDRARSRHVPDRRASPAELHVAQMLMRAQGGQIEHKSRPDGETFHLTIPVERRRAPPRRGNGRD
jgi:signal transduction histidine kinase